jgi:hypothetical protein
LGLAVMASALDGLLSFDCDDDRAARLRTEVQVAALKAHRWNVARARRA